MTGIIVVGDAEWVAKNYLFLMIFSNSTFPYLSESNDDRTVWISHYRVHEIVLYGVEFIQKLLSFALFHFFPSFNEHLFMSIRDHSCHKRVIKKIDSIGFI
jgi:hypothetical protein